MPNYSRQDDGDSGFIGIDTRNNPSTLKAGVLQDGRNIRLDLATLQTRKGLKKILSDTYSGIIGNVLGAGMWVRADGSERVILVVSDGLYVVDLATGIPSSKYSFFGRNVTATDNLQVLQAVNKIYILRGEATIYINGNGAVGQRVVATNGSNVVTVTTLNPHGLVVGNEFIVETSHAPLNGTFIIATVANSTTFTYTLPLNHNANNNTPYVIQVAKPVLCFDGTSVSVVRQGIIDGTLMVGTTPTECDFPPTSTAIYHKNRIYCKYSRDEIAVSDYLPNINGDWKFDLTIQALTINQGDEQEIVGFHPWTRDEILVFKTNSIYAARFADNTSSPDVILAESYVRTLTYDIGCVAKRSVANISGYVFFLSRKGVYRLEPQLDTNLLANTAPMSIGIQKYVDRINQTYVKNAVATVYNGRYFLAVPLDNSQVNNYVFVYNLTNQMWESVDTYPANFNAKGILSAIKDNQSKMLFWTQVNGLYLSEELDVDQFGNTVNGVSINNGVSLPFTLIEEQYENQPIAGFAKTRRYIFGTLEDKRFVSGSLDMLFEGNGSAVTSAVTYNPDTIKTVDISTSNYTEDKTRNFPIRKVATGCDLEINTTSGRPIIRSIGIEATIVGRNTKNTQ